MTSELTEFILSQGLFSPELVNRFDAVVVYHPLSQQDVVKVSKLLLLEFAKNLKETKNITLEISEELAQKVAEKSFDPQSGARPIRRFIQDNIEDTVAKMLIEGKVKEGDKIEPATLLSVVS